MCVCVWHVSRPLVNKCPSPAQEEQIRQRHEVERQQLEQQLEQQQSRQASQPTSQPASQPTSQPTSQPASQEEARKQPEPSEVGHPESDVMTQPNTDGQPMENPEDVSCSGDAVNTVPTSASDGACNGAGSEAVAPETHAVDATVVQSDLTKAKEETSS